MLAGPALAQDPAIVIRTRPDARRDSIDRPGRNLLDGHPRPQARQPRAIGPDLRPLRNRAIGSDAIHDSTISSRSEIGGADVVRNLWPEPRRTLAGDWDDTRKDQLERRLAILVCAGQLDAREAQKAIAEDWAEAYERFVRVAQAAMEPR